MISHRRKNSGYPMSTYRQCTHEFNNVMCWHLKQIHHWENGLGSSALGSSY